MEILSLGVSADVVEEECENKARRLSNILLKFIPGKNGRHASLGLANISQKLPLKRSVIETMSEPEVACSSGSISAFEKGVRKRKKPVINRSMYHKNRSQGQRLDGAFSIKSDLLRSISLL